MLQVINEKTSESVPPPITINEDNNLNNQENDSHEQSVEIQSKKMSLTCDKTDLSQKSFPVVTEKQEEVHNVSVVVTICAAFPIGNL